MEERLNHIEADISKLKADIAGIKTDVAILKSNFQILAAISLGGLLANVYVADDKVPLTQPVADKEIN